MSSIFFRPENLKTKSHSYLIMKPGVTYFFLKDHSCLQSRHDVLKQATSCSIKGKFSAGHHVAVHKLQREIKINHLLSELLKTPIILKATFSNPSNNLTAFIKSSFLNRILRRCPNMHSGSALPSGKEENVNTYITLKISSKLAILWSPCFCYTRMSVIKRVRICFVVLLCLLLDKL